MGAPIKLLDVVALTEDLPDKKLYRGQVGTVVHVYTTDVFEVEFCDDDGRTYGLLPLKGHQLLLLHHRPLQVA